MRLFRWFSTLTVAIVLAGATPTLALDMTDEAARERVADWAHRCHFLFVDDLWGTGLNEVFWDIIADEQRGREFLARVQEKGGPVSAAREYLETCMPVYRRVADAGQLELCSDLGRTVTRMGHHWLDVLGDTDRYPDTQGQLDSTAQQAVEDYLQTCVPPYAAALDGRLPADVPASGSHATADQTGPLHGSIAFSQEGDGSYAWGIAWSFDSSAGAQSEAIIQCREYGGTQCAEAGWFQEACGALAIGSGNGYGTGWGVSIAEAERDALARCRLANDDCRIEVARCSQSEEAGGQGRTESKVVTLEGFSSSNILLGPGMQVGTRVFTAEDYTFELPQEKSTCHHVLVSLIASCLEWIVSDDGSVADENRQCATHFKDEGMQKCGLTPEDDPHTFGVDYWSWPP